MFGPVFATASKPGLPAAGADALRAVVSATRLPVIAVGGIAPPMTGAIRTAGAAGFA
jgi:thiamine monophosphate synthase